MRSGWFALHFQKPTMITEVNADGDNLICIGPYDDPIIYYMKWTDFKWQGRWGLYLWLGFALGPPSWVRTERLKSACTLIIIFQIRLPPDNLGYAISHRGSYSTCWHFVICFKDPGSPPLSTKTPTWRISTERSTTPSLDAQLYTSLIRTN